MPAFAERIAARIAFLHARRVYARFRRSLREVEQQQHGALRRALSLVADSEFGK